MGLRFSGVVVIFVVGCGAPPQVVDPLRDDGGRIDAGAPGDAGPSAADAGSLDAGSLDAGATVVGAFDAGGRDAGLVDAGLPPIRGPAARKPQGNRPASGFGVGFDTSRKPAAAGVRQGRPEILRGHRHAHGRTVGGDRSR